MEDVSKMEVRRFLKRFLPVTRVESVDLEDNGDLQALVEVDGEVVRMNLYVSLSDDGGLNIIYGPGMG